LSAVGQDANVEYDYDSEAEWEPEPDDGEDCLSMDEGDEEDA
jgi:hypothetical protein